MFYEPFWKYSSCEICGETYQYDSANLAALFLATGYCSEKCLDKAIRKNELPNWMSL